MPIDFMLLDTGVADSVDGFDNNNVLVSDDTVTVAKIIDKLKETITKRGIKMRRLLIFAHGLEAPNYYSDDLFQCKERPGGYGVQLGSDYLTTSKTGEFAKLKGLFSGDGIIEFRSCAIAANNPDTAGQWGGKNAYTLSGNGRRFLLEIAAHADIKVKASDAVQWQTFRLNDKFLGFNMGNRTLEFKDKWEGNVYIFNPATQSATRIQG